MPKRHRLLERTELLIKRELDLVKVVTKLRMQALATLGSLTPQRRALVHKMAEIIVDDSSTDHQSAAANMESIGTYYNDEAVKEAIRDLSRS